MAQDMHYLVDQQDSGVRIDAYLGARDGLPSRSACSRLIEAGAVTLNGDACTSKKYAVQPGDRIAQLAVMPVVQAELERVDSLDDTERGTGGFGSTGK